MLNSLFSRRRLIASGSLASAGIALAKLAFDVTMQDTSAHSPADAKSPLSVVPAYLGSSPQTLPPFPYAENALEPVISITCASCWPALRSRRHRLNKGLLHRQIWTGSEPEKGAAPEVSAAPRMARYLSCVIH